MTHVWPARSSASTWRNIVVWPPDSRPLVGSQTQATVSGSSGSAAIAGGSCQPAAAISPRGAGRPRGPAGAHGPAARGDPRADCRGARRRRRRPRCAGAGASDAAGRWGSGSLMVLRSHTSLVVENAPEAAVLPRTRVEARTRPPRWSGDEPAYVQRDRPSYNYASVLEDCVTSVLEQEGVDVRVLIVDDCSPDDTATVGRALAERDERVEFRSHEANVGLIGTANEGIEWAQGEFSLLLSADDLVTPGAFARAAEVMRRHPRVGLVYGQAPYWQRGSRCRRRRLAGPGRASGRRRLAAEDLPPPRRHLVAGGDRPHVGAEGGRRLRPRVLPRERPQHVAAHRRRLRRRLRTRRTAGDLPRPRRQHAAQRPQPGHRPPGAPQGLRLVLRSGAEGLPNAAALEALATRALARQALWRASRATDRDLEGYPLDEVEFALDVYDRTRSLPEWRGLQLRRASAPAGRAGSRSSWRPAPPTGCAARRPARAGRAWVCDMELVDILSVLARHRIGLVVAMVWRCWPVPRPVPI